jgi:hypothetical protein
MQGVVVGLTNPKAVVFFAAVLPQFVGTTASRPSTQMFFLGLLFVQCRGPGDPSGNPPKRQTVAVLSGVTGAELVENPAFSFRWSSGASVAAGDGRGCLRRWGGCPVDETGGGVDCPDPFLDHSYHLDDSGRVAKACAHHVAR